MAGDGSHLALSHGQREEGFSKGNLNSHSFGQSGLRGKGYMCLPLQITAAATTQEQPSHGHGAQGQMAPQSPSQQPHPTIITPSELKGLFSITSADNASLLLPGGGTQVQGCL